MDLLELSRMAEKLSAMATPARRADASFVSQLPGVAPDPQAGAEAMRDVVNGTQGRLSKPAIGGARVKQLQGPRAYAPRLSMDMP